MHITQIRIYMDHHQGTPSVYPVPVITLTKVTKTPASVTGWIHPVLEIIQHVSLSWGERGSNPSQRHLAISVDIVPAWRIPGTGEPGGLPSMGSHRVGHDWSDLVAAAAAADIFGLTTRRVPWSSSGQRPRVLLNILQSWTSLASSG